MSDVEIDGALVGRKVCHATRPEWGVGTVLRVETVTIDGQPAHRVSVQFAVGHRQVLVPPGRLIEPPSRDPSATGWLDSIAKTTPQDRLRRLPESATDVLGPPAQRIAALAPLFEYTEDPPALLRWAQAQMNVADPLAHWSRDELLVAFGDFCRRRDDALRQLAFAARRAGEPEAIERALAGVAADVRERMRAALSQR